MERRFELNWKRAALAGGAVGLVTVAACFLASGSLTAPAPGALAGGHEHLHGQPGAFFPNLFKVYVPRQVCMFHEPGVIWLHFVSDFLISLSYFSIPVALVYFVRRRRDVAFSWVFWMFAAFIMLCGTTHVIGMWDLWQPLYKIDGIVKLITGLVSVVTAISLWPLLPKALALPSPAMLEQKVKERTAELASANEERAALLNRERELRADAERVNRSKDEFLATLSHELRTPLNAILGWSQILKRKNSNPELAEGIAIIERNTRAQSRLVEDLLDMSSIVSGKLRLEMQPVNLVEVIEAAVQTVKPAADAKGIVIQKALDPHTGTVSGDSARLQQVIWNLLFNAVKFTPQSGRVKIFLEKNDSGVQLSIVDTGPGIRADFMPFLFDRFRQADSSTTRQFGGLGLGLAIAKHLVELHGGTIEAESGTVGTGTKFTITIPITKLAEARGLVSEHHAKQNGVVNGSVSLDGCKILAVDDQEDTLSFVRQVLEEHGAKVFTALDSKEGFDIFRSQNPDLVLCDIGMPVEDGYGFLRRVRALSTLDGGDTPVVALTAFTRKEDISLTKTAGFDMHIPKPVETSSLLEIVAQLVQRH